MELFKIVVSGQSCRHGLVRSFDTVVPYHLGPIYEIFRRLQVISKLSEHLNVRQWPSILRALHITAVVAKPAVQQLLQPPTVNAVGADELVQRTARSMNHRVAFAC